MGNSGQDRLTESSGSLNDTAKCEEFHILVLRYEKHKNQIKSCALEPKVTDWQIECVELVGL